MRKLIKKEPKPINISKEWAVLSCFLFFNMLIIIGMLFLNITWIAKFSLDIFILILAKDDISKLIFKSKNVSLEVEK